MRAGSRHVWRSRRVYVPKFEALLPLACKEGRGDTCSTASALHGIATKRWAPNPRHAATVV
jgi:hypothetical protein